MKKWIGLLFLLLVGLAACSADLPATPTPPLSTPEPAPVILTVVPSAQATLTATFIPKQNDLLFIEFFAVT